MKFTFVDAFVGPKFLGNQAAVAIVDLFSSDQALADIARELRLPAAAFLRRLDDGEHHIRWFTPEESDFCGHGTLAATHVLFETGAIAPESVVRFHSKAGKLSARKVDGWIELDLPSFALTPMQIPPDVERALGTKILSAHDAKGRILLEVDGEDAIKMLSPDVPLLRSLLGQAVIVTSKAAAPYDFVSRYFRKVGDAEDPVTGSAHCALTPFWSLRLKKDRLLAYQASTRGGVLRLQYNGARVTIAGQAVTCRNS